MLSSRKTLGHFVIAQSQNLTALTRRFYLAEQCAIIPKIEACVTQPDEDKQIYTLNTVAYPEKLTTASNAFQRLKQFYKKEWRVVLIIQNDTLGYNVEFKNHTNPFQFRQYHCSYVFENPTRFIDLNLLYAIPQETWDNFINKLKHQTIVDKLGLRKHRHLWAAYSQYNDQSDDARVQHAEWIGKYHFLISLHALSRHDELTYTPIAARKQIESLTEHSYQRDHNPLKVLASIHPACTPLFFKKVAHIPNILDVVNLARLTYDYACTFPPHPRYHSGSIFIKPSNLQNAINWLPFSKEPNESANTVTALHFAQAFDRQQNGALFFSTRKAWQSNTSIQTTLPRIRVTAVEDYLSALYQDLISREINQELKKYVLNDALKYRLHQKLQKIILKEIISHCAYTQLDTLQSRWHINHNYIEAAKPSYTNNPTWSALTDPQTIQGVTISAITDEASLKAHGSEMKHCVGGYASKCLNNTTDIFELNDNAGNCSTLEVGHHQQKFYLQQHRAKSNKSPSAEHKIAANLFVEGLNNQSIALNQKRLAEKPSRTEHQPAHQYTDEDQEKIYAAYHQHKLLPVKFMANNKQAMLASLNLHEHIQKTLDTALLPDVSEREDAIETQLRQERENIGGCMIM